MKHDEDRNLPYMQLYPADYFKDTRHLSTLQHGAYILLIMNYWVKGKLPDDDHQLARIAGLTTREWAKCRPILIELFKPGWKHKRIEEELAKARKKSESRRDAGFRGVEAKSLKNQDANEANGLAKRKQTRQQNASKGQAFSSETQITDKKEEETSSLLAKADEAQSALDVYNRIAAEAGFPKAIKLTAPRRSSIRKRLDENGGLAGWTEAMQRASRSSFLTGKNKDGWTADIDFFLQPSKFTKLIEGRYDDRTRKTNSADYENRSSADSILSAARRRLAREDPSGRSPSAWNGDHSAAAKADDRFSRAPVIDHDAQERFDRDDGDSDADLFVPPPDRFR